MAQLSDLPNELLLQIIELVSLDDIESFSLISKRIRHLAATALQLQHARRKLQYENVSNIIEPEPGKTFQPDGVVADLLCTIIRYPRVGQYIQKLHLKELRRSSGLLGTNNEENNISGAYNHDHVPYALKISLLKGVVINGNNFHPKPIESSWNDVLRKGHEIALVARLSHYLPNLQEIRIANGQGTYHETNFKDILHSRYLTRLKVVHLTRFGGRECLAMIRKAMALPSVTTIHVHGCTIDSFHNSNPRIPQKPSRVKELIFGASHIDEEILSRLIESVEALEAFSLEHRGSDGSPPIITSLLSHSGHTLKSLRLGGDCQTRYGSLCDFKVLADIDIDASLLSTLGGRNIERFADLLPTSIEKLKIRFKQAPYPNMVGVYKIRKFLLTMIKASQQGKLPRLKEVNVRVPETEQGSRIVETLKEVTRSQRRALRSSPIWIDIYQGRFACPCKEKYNFMAWRTTKFGPAT